MTPLWSKTTKNPDKRTGLLACLLAQLTHSFAPHCLLRMRAPQYSFVRLVNNSFTNELEGK